MLVVASIFTTACHAILKARLAVFYIAFLDSFWRKDLVEFIKLEGTKLLN